MTKLNQAYGPVERRSFSPCSFTPHLFTHRKANRYITMLTTTRTTHYSMTAGAAMRVLCAPHTLKNSKEFYSRPRRPRDQEVVSFPRRTLCRVHVYNSCSGVLLLCACVLILVFVLRGGQQKSSTTSNVSLITGEVPPWRAREKERAGNEEKLH